MFVPPRAITLQSPLAINVTLSQTNSTEVAPKLPISNNSCAVFSETCPTPPEPIINWGSFGLQSNYLLLFGGLSKAISFFGSNFGAASNPRCLFDDQVSTPAQVVSSNTITCITPTLKTATKPMSVAVQLSNKKI